MFSCAPLLIAALLLGGPFNARAEQAEMAEVEARAQRAEREVEALQRSMQAEIEGALQVLTQGGGARGGCVVQGRALWIALHISHGLAKRCSLLPHSCRAGRHGCCRR